MTPAERARHIEQQEFEAERKAIRLRAQRYAAQRRRKERARIDAWIGRPAPEGAGPKPRKPKPAKLYTYDGQTKTLSEWVISTGVSAQTLRRRLRSGMPIEQAIAEQPRQTSQLRTVNSESRTLQQWADYIGITYWALLARMRTRSLAEALAMPKGAGRWQRGVSSNLEAFEGTGAGSTAQEIPEIDFSNKAENA
ncbi:hypothetical protein [Mesorhizobium sp. A623]